MSVSVSVPCTSNTEIQSKTQSTHAVLKRDTDLSEIENNCVTIISPSVQFSVSVSSKINRFLTLTQFKPTVEKLANTVGRGGGGEKDGELKEETRVGSVELF